jgi:Xaa-Pro aminopeptidase
VTDATTARLSSLRDALARADLDALLVSALPNVRYLTGFSGSNALVVVTALRMRTADGFPLRDAGEG